ncbi:MAG: DUF4062 domain-containing protein [Acidobacteria bacterium]|nr:DUF4062 domain-containing protein [Acidobacteriota bacterium]
MAIPIARLRLLLSSTSELEAERLLIEEAIADVNRVIEDLCGASIRLVDWRRDVVPGIATDPQRVINEQTGDYDIYVGVLGSRFGTPTPRAGSGTEDEFNAAYARFRTDPTSVRLLFYFRTALVGSVQTLDLDQLRRVQEFRARLTTEKGAFFCDYGSPEEFIKLFRNHVIQLVRTQWAGNAWKPVEGVGPSKPEAIERLVEGETAPADRDDEPELLDLRVEMDAAFAAAMVTLGKVSEWMKRSTEADRTWQLEATRFLGSGNTQPKKAQELVNAKAKDFETRARELRTLTSAFKAASDEFFETTGALVEVQIRSGLSTPEEMSAGLRKLGEADAGARAVRDLYDSLALSVSSLRAPTREFKRQQRNLRLQMEQFSAAVASWLDRSAGLRARFGGDSGEEADGRAV